MERHSGNFTVVVGDSGGMHGAHGVCGVVDTLGTFLSLCGMLHVPDC